MSEQRNLVKFKQFKEKYKALQAENHDDELMDALFMSELLVDDFQSLQEATQVISELIQNSDLPTGMPDILKGLRQSLKKMSLR